MLKSWVFRSKDCKVTSCQSWRFEKKILLLGQSWTSHVRLSFESVWVQMILKVSLTATLQTFEVQTLCCLYIKSSKGWQHFSNRFGPSKRPHFNVVCLQGGGLFSSPLYVYNIDTSRIEGLFYILYCRILCNVYLIIWKEFYTTFEEKGKWKIKYQRISQFETINLKKDFQKMSTIASRLGLGSLVSGLCM